MARYVDIECDAVTEVLPRRAFKTRQDIQDFLDNIPTADVVSVVHGRWKLLHAGDWTSVCVCSVCGRRETVSSSDMCNPENRMSKIYPFCHCGARMDGGESNETD